MSHSGSIITAPVQMQSDLASVLGIPGTDLAASCQSSAINKWAKFKPFRCNQIAITPVVDSNGFPVKQLAIGSHYRYLIDANCGLRINYRNYGRDACLQKTISMMNAGNDDDIWTYEKPTGGTNQPFRLVDFCGYNNDARPFLWQTNIYNKQIGYRGIQDEGKLVDFGIDVYDSDNESTEGMIEADDLNDTLYNGNDLYYFCVICDVRILNSFSSSYVYSVSKASQPISSVDGRTASFTMYMNSSGLLLQGNFATPMSRTGVRKFCVFHILGRYDGSNYTFLPIPYSSDYLPITNLEIVSERTSVEFDISALANFASNGAAIRSLTFQDINNDIAIHRWSGVTVRLDLTNSYTSPITVNLGTVYCQTNCHSSPVACEAVYNSSYQSISNQVTVPAASGGTLGRVSIYMTFKDVFDFNNNGYITINNTDVEISFWGEYNGSPTISAQTWGNDGTIIYYNI